MKIIKRNFLILLVTSFSVLLIGCTGQDPNVSIESDRSEEDIDEGTPRGSSSSSFEPDPKDCYGDYKNSNGEWLLTALDVQGTLGGSWVDHNFKDTKGCLSFVRSGSDPNDYKASEFSFIPSLVHIQTLLNEFDRNIAAGSSQYEKIGSDHYRVSLSLGGGGSMVTDYKVIEGIGDQALLQIPDKSFGFGSGIYLHISKGGRQIALVCSKGKFSTIECTDEQFAAVGRIIASRMP